MSEQKPTESAEVAQKNIQYEDRIVLFMDILGFKNLVKKSETEDCKFTKMCSAVDFLFDTSKGVPRTPSQFIRELKIKVAENKAMKIDNHVFDDFQYTHFSDSLIISYIYKNNTFKDSFSCFTNTIADIGDHLLKAGLSVRGGVAAGKLFHKGSIVIGPAFVEAYEIESTISKNPRILLSDKLLAIVQNHFNDPSDFLHENFHRYEDGHVGFDQLSYINMKLNRANSIGNVFEELEEIRAYIVASLDESFTNQSVHEKYKWLRNQFNKIARKYKNAINIICDENHLIETKCLTFEEVDKLENTGEYR